MTTRFETLRSLCAARRSRRAFADRPLPDELIEQIRSLAMTSPYASGKRNWEIMVVTERGVREAMAHVVEQRISVIRAQIRADHAEDFAAYARQFTAFLSAPALFIPTFRVAPSLSLLCPDPEGQIARWERDTFVKSISCVAMLILLAAEALDLAACYMTGALIADEALGQLIAVKNGRSIGAIIPVGYRTEED